MHRFSRHRLWLQDFARHAYRWVVVFVLVVAHIASVNAQLPIDESPPRNDPAILSKAPQLTSVAIVSVASGETVPSDTNKSTLIDTPVMLYAAVQANNNQWFASVPQIQVGNKTVRAQPWNEQAWGVPDIRWFKVEPYPWHIYLPAPDDQKPDDFCYANAAPPGSPRQYSWIDIDTIEYFTTPQVQASGHWHLLADANPSFIHQPSYQGLGTMRYQVQVGLFSHEHEYPVQMVASPGQDATTTMGISNRVHRITYRLDDSYIGQLTGWINVPGVFGSLPRQVDDYLGSDCADLVLGAWRKMGHTLDYTNVAGLRNIMQPMTDPIFLDRDGGLYADIIHSSSRCINPIQFRYDYDRFYMKGYTIMFALNPSPTGRWFHVGVVALDQNPDGNTPNGYLDMQDLVIHSDRVGTRIVPLGEIAHHFSIPAKIQIFSWP